MYKTGFLLIKRNVLGCGSSPVKRKVIIRISLIDVPPKNGARYYGLDEGLVIEKLVGRLCCMRNIMGSISA